MNNDRELLQQALYYMDDNCGAYSDEYRKLIEALRARLAQPEPEPVAWMHDSHVGFNVPLYTTPPQREWQGLTDEDVWEIPGYDQTSRMYRFARAIEAKLKEKNT